MRCWGPHGQIQVTVLVIALVVGARSMGVLYTVEVSRCIAESVTKPHADQRWRLLSQG